MVLSKKSVQVVLVRTGQNLFDEPLGMVFIVLPQTTCMTVGFHFLCPLGGGQWLATFHNFLHPTVKLKGITICPKI